MTISTPPIVSIVLPVYNGEKYLSETIGSILDQSFQSWELIIVEDGSQDRTPEIAARYCHDDPSRMRLLRHPGGRNRGPFASRVLGAQYASSDLIALIDADDIWDSNYLEDHLRLWHRLESKDVALSYGPSLYWYPGDGSDLKDFVQSIPEGGPRIYEPGELLQCFFNTDYRVTPCPSATLIRGSLLVALEKFGIFAKSIGAFEDQITWWMTAKDYPILVHDNVWVRYRQHDSNSSLSRTEEDRERARQNERAFLDFMANQLSETLPYDPLVAAGAVRERIAALDSAGAHCSATPEAFSMAPSRPLCMAAEYTSSPRTNWNSGQTEVFAITVTNAGAEVWEVRGPNRVRLGVHFGANSDLPHDGWTTDQRFEFPHRVEPGGRVTLAVGITAPATSGAYTLRCRVVTEGVAWADQIHKTPVTVAPATEATSVGSPTSVLSARGIPAAAYGPDPSGAPRGWRPRQTQVYTVAVTNVGSQAWETQGPNPVRLGVHFGGDSDLPDDGWATDQRFALPGDVAPGQTVILALGVTAPRAPGTYTLRHRMVREGVAWSDHIQKAVVTVRTPGDPANSRSARGSGRGPTFLTTTEMRAARRRLRSFIGLRPLSRVWGADRGQPIHRYFVEQFLQEFIADIRGSCLEFQDPAYTPRFGGSSVGKLDILHIDDSNPLATIVADLTRQNSIPSNSFDCIVCTHVLHVIFDTASVIRELYRILKPGGVLLVAVPQVSMYGPEFSELWRFTPQGVGMLLTGVFGVDNVTVRGYGNSLTAAGEIRGVVASEFTQAELDEHDVRFTVEVCARAVKGLSPTDQSASTGRAEARPMCAQSEGARSEDREADGNQSSNLEGRPSLAILMYHGVTRSPLDVADWCFVDESVFRSHVHYLKEHFDVLTLSEAVSRLRSGELHRPTAVITLDDGFQNNYDVAFPILREAGLPATLFLATGLVDTDDTIWCCRVNRAVAIARVPRVEWDVGSFDLDGPEAKAKASHRIQERLKRFPQPELVAQLREVICILGDDPDRAVEPNSPFRILSREAIAEMTASGLIEFGGHTRSHAILSRLPLQEVRDEIESSLETTRKLTGRRCELFAYPNGTDKDYGADSIQILEGNGVRAAVTAIWGSNDRTTPPLELRRFGIGPDWSVADLNVAMLSGKSPRSAPVRAFLETTFRDDPGR